MLFLNFFVNFHIRNFIFPLLRIGDTVKSMKYPWPCYIINNGKLYNFPMFAIAFNSEKSHNSIICFYV